ncbi:MAG: sugar phosphate isomerase/epimerase [Planctomycetes bacterium]|nr:sugar phosphate isomerase/epimerase [Planctomycetota bacterium]
MDRRNFLQSLLGASMVAVAGCHPPQTREAGHSADGNSLANSTLRISLAEWSLHRALQGQQMTNLDFPKKARSFGIGAVEYVNSFFKDKAEDEAYLSELLRRCDDEGVRSLLIMIDGEGALGAQNAQNRAQAVQNHHRWVQAAQFLGCHSIRVNAAGGGEWDEAQKNAADGLRSLCEYADDYGVNVIVENHGGLSSNGAWLAGVMEMVDHPRVGTLPDFGNFRLGGGKEYDRYQGVMELMPYAKAVSAKSHDFDATGNETHTDYKRMMNIVREAGYTGYVGIEYEGGGLSEDDGILATKSLLMANGVAL